MKKLLLKSFLALLATGFLFTACSNSSDDDGDGTVDSVKIAIISDVHLYDKDTLGSDSSDGTALADYLASDRKMLLESEAILDSALTSIKASGVEYLLISGDLTKDGEKVNHELLASKLAEVEESGIQVFVTNGNHDLSNANAVKFSGSSTTQVDTVDTDDFREIYKNFGYDSDEVVAMDSGSLSYAVDLGETYRLIVMDSCIYNDYTSSPSQETEGQILDTEMDWIKSQIAAAKAAGRTPIGMMHHGLVEHIPSVQTLMFKEYLVDDYENIRESLSSLGMNVVFTGHFHSQDIASVEISGSNFYDVETGSLATSPCPIRYVTLDTTFSGKHTLTCETKDVTSVEGITDFANYGQTFLENGMEDLFNSYMPALLIQMGMATDATSAATATTQILASKLIDADGDDNDYTVCDLLTAGFIAHYKGDEDLTSDANAQAGLTALQTLYTKASDESTKTLYGTLATVVNNLYTDSETDDRDVTFNF